MQDRGLIVPTLAPCSGLLDSCASCARPAPCCCAVVPIYEPPPGRFWPRAAHACRARRSPRLALGRSTRARHGANCSVSERGAVALFVVNDVPPILDQPFGGVASQHSNGIGGPGGQLNRSGIFAQRSALRGSVLRATFTSDALTYRATASLGELDEVSHAQRRLHEFIGNPSVLGVFTLGGRLRTGCGAEQATSLLCGRQHWPCY